MKKLLIALLALILLLAGGIFLAPLLFGDQIKAKVKDLANEQLDARVDFSEIDLSFLRDFPNLSLVLEQPKIIGKGTFEQDTLLQAQELSVSLNLMSLLGSKMQIYGVSLQEGDIRVLVQPDGKANYDIYLSQEEEGYDDPLAAEEEPLEINIDHWEVTRTNILYLDYQMGLAARVEQLNHKGSGQIRSQVYDLKTQTTVEGLSVHYQQTDYFENLPLQADMTLNIDNSTSTYTFRENRLKARDLPLQFEGWIRMPENSPMDMDLSFEAPENTFKSLLSLVPPAYLKDYEGLKTEGNFTLEGSVKGKYDGEKEKYPGFRLHLQTSEAKVQYPDLPTAISAINMDMEIHNASGDLEQTITDIRQFSLLLGRHPVKGELHLKGLERFEMKGKIDARMNLADLPNLYPLEDITEIKGDFRMSLNLNGTYDEAREQLPAFTADMSLKEGFLRTKDYPDLPLKGITMAAKAANTSGRQTDTEIQFEPLAFELDGKPFRLAGKVRNLDAPTYSLTAKGSVNLEKMLQLFPQEGMEVSGLLTADLQTSGSMAAIEAENYTQLPTSGTFGMQNFSFKSTDLPQGMKITTLAASFTPQVLQIQELKGFLGKSDIRITGGLSNYLAYGLAAAGMGKGQPILQGNMTMNSKLFDANEWLLEEAEGESADTLASEAVQLPEDVNFRFEATIDKVLYDDMTLENAAGLIVIKDGVLNLNNLKFNTLGGEFLTYGTYDPRDARAPKFDFGLDIVGAQIQESFNTFSPVQAFAPLAKSLVGEFSSQVRLKGSLTPDLMPRLETLTGLSSLIVQQAAFGTQKPQIISSLGEFTGLNQLDGATFRDVKMKTRFENGALSLDPVNFDLAGYPAMITGTTGLDGKLDLDFDITLPKAEVAGKLKEWFGVGADGIKGETFDLHLKIGGTHSSPKLGLDKVETKEQMKGLLKESAKNQAANLLESFLGGEEEEQTESTAPKDSLATRPQTDSLKQQAADTLKKQEQPKKENTPVEEVRDKTRDLQNTLKKWGIGKKKEGGK